MLNVCSSKQWLGFPPRPAGHSGTALQHMEFGCLRRLCSCMWWKQCGGRKLPHKIDKYVSLKTFFIDVGMLVDTYALSQLTNHVFSLVATAIVTKHIDQKKVSIIVLTKLKRQQFIIYWMPATHQHCVLCSRWFACVPEHMCIQSIIRPCSQGAQNMIGRRLTQNSLLWSEKYKQHA